MSKITADSTGSTRLGSTIRRLRRENGLTQARMAEELGVSASYLNLLERNQRPVTAQILLRLADAYDLDLRSLSADDPGGGAGLEEVLADKMFADLGVSRHEAAEVAELSPGLAEAMTRLYRAYLDRGRMIDLGAFERPDGAGLVTEQSPTDWVRDLVGAQRNHFAELEVLAEAIQTVVRAEIVAGRSQISDPYALLKDLTRGRRVGVAELAEFVRGLDIGDAAKERLLALTPASYTGLASDLVSEIE